MLTISGRLIPKCSLLCEPKCVCFILTVKVSYIPDLKKGEKYAQCVQLAFHEEIGDTGLTNTKWAWSGNSHKRKLGDEIVIPTGYVPEFYTSESVDEETGEMLKFEWVRWVES